MKKHIAVFAVALLLFAACEGSDDTDNNAAAVSNSSGGIGKDVGDGGAQTVKNMPKGSYRNECAPTAPDPWPEADMNDPSVISFDEDLFFTVDGERFFPLGFYNAPDDAEGMADYKAEGFNITRSGPGCCGGTSLQDQLDFLDRAKDNGLFAFMHPWSNEESLLTRPDTELEAELAPRITKGSLFGWYTFDEPGINHVDLAVTHRMHEVLSTYDPTHLDGLVEAPVTDFGTYMDDCAFFMIDPYPSNWMPLIYVKYAILEAKEAIGGTKPLMGVPQGFSWMRYFDMEVPAEEFHPTALELRNMAWQFIVHGGKALVYWTYSGDYSIKAEPTIWPEFLDMIAEINELMRVILSNDIPVSLHPDATVPQQFDYSAKQGDDSTFIFSVSTNPREMMVDLDFSDLGTGLCIVDYTTGESFTQDADGHIQVLYGDYQARIFQVF